MRKVIVELPHRPTRQFVGCLSKIVNFTQLKQPKYLASKTCCFYHNKAYIDMDPSSNNLLHNISPILNSRKKYF